MIAYRLSREKYARDLSGEGARKAGGRWNSRGIPLVYTSQSISLCALEVAVHLPLGMAPKDYHLVSILIPDETPMLEIPFMKLPLNWNVSLHSLTTQAIGDDFIDQAQHMVMKVPSAVVIQEYNYLINPAHVDIKQVQIIEIIPFRFDDRLFSK